MPVGVAYGSDTAMVRDTLLEIVNNHDGIIKGNPDLPEPSVLFIGLGDSSLNFEVRAIVSNINKRLHVISDINFAIDAAFREHGIEIPFPQRDLNFRGPLQKEFPLMLLSIDILGQYDTDPRGIQMNEIHSCLQLIHINVNDSLCR